MWDIAEYPFWHGSAPMSYILSVAGPDEMFTRGEGCWLVDHGGRRFLDARAGIANMILGYGRHDIADAMHRQALELPFVCTLRYDRPAPATVEYAGALAAAAPAALTRVRFTHTGSSAVEAALLMARRYQANHGRPERFHIVSLAGSFHGSTLMTMAASGQPTLHSAFAPMPDGFHYAPAPEPEKCSTCRSDASQPATCADGMLDVLAEIGPQQVAAVLLEPVCGLSGVPLPSHYLAAVADYCARHEILLIFDEVFSGLGRMGPMFAAEISGVSPDIMCLSKTLTAGYAPLGAVLATDRVYSAFIRPGRAFGHGSSTDAHPMACAAGLATLEAIRREGLIDEGSRMGSRLGTALARELSGYELVREVRSLGAFVAIELNAFTDFMTMMMAKRHMQAECERRGVLIDYTPAIIMLAPPYVLSDDDSDLLTETVAAVLREFKEEVLRTANIRPPSVSGRR